MSDAPPPAEPPTKHYDLRTLAQRVELLEQRISDQGMLLAQLRELVTGEPVFVPPADDWPLNE